MICVQTFAGTLDFMNRVYKFNSRDYSVFDELDEEKRIYQF